MSLVFINVNIWDILVFSTDCRESPYRISNKMDSHCLKREEPISHHICGAWFLLWLFSSDLLSQKLNRRNIPYLWHVLMHLQRHQYSDNSKIWSSYKRRTRNKWPPSVGDFLSHSIGQSKLHGQSWFPCFVVLCI